MSENSSPMKTAGRAGMIWGVLTMLLGFFAMGSPFVTGLLTAQVLGVVLLVAGFSMAIFSFQAPSLGKVVLKLLFGILTVLVGLAILGEPGIALAKLTLFLGIYFLADGFLMFILAWNVKPQPGWGWMTFNGAVTILLGWMILNNLPASALWAVGVLVGVRLVFSGITMLTLGSAASQLTDS